jgi:hypothetical protein
MQRSCPSFAVVVIEPGNVGPVETADSGMLREGQVQDRRLAVADQRLGIGARSIEVDAIGDAVRTFAALGSEDRPNARVAQRSVQVPESLLVRAGEIVTVPILDMRADLYLELPGAQKLNPALERISFGWTRRRNDGDAVAWQ